MKTACDDALRSRRLALPPTNRGVRGRAAYQVFHRRDRRPNGNTRRRCRSAGAILSGEPGDHAEVFVMVRGEPARVVLGGLRRAARGGALAAISSSLGAAFFVLLSERTVLADRFVRHTISIRLAEMGRSSAAPLHGSGADGELDFAAARFHFFEGVGRSSRRISSVDEIVREDVAAANGFERLANESAACDGMGR